VRLEQVIFALNKGTATSMSQGFALGGLEQRTHLSAAPLSASYPLIRGSTWPYGIVDDGKHLTSTEPIATQTKRIHGERAFQRISDWSDGSRDISLENFSAGGQLHLHRVGDDSSQLTFSPAVSFPKLARVGQRVQMTGRLDFTDGSVHLTGTYHTDVQVTGTERITVPAGTFATIKVRMKVVTSVEYHKNGDNLVMKDVGTETEWLAKGVGTIKNVQKTHFDDTTNGRREVSDGMEIDVLRSYSIPR